VETAEELPGWIIRLDQDRLQKKQTGPFILLLRSWAMSIFKKPFTGSSTAVILLRIIIGLIFFGHGAQKVFGWFGGYGLPATVGFFSSSGIPALLAYVAAFTELLGGIAMLLGLFTRIFSIGLIINMLVAIFVVHISKGFLNPGGFEFPLTLLVVALAIFLLGPGKYSIDNFIFGKTSVDKS
jgi:putative oxidoreductase